MKRLIGIALTLALGIGVVGTANAASNPSGGLRLIVVHRSLLGTHRWYQQTFRGHPVIGGYVARHVDGAGRLMLVQDGRRPVGGAVASLPSVPRTVAARSAVRLVRGRLDQPELAVLPGRQARLVWSATVVGLRGSVRVLLDATTGQLIRIDRLVKEATGTGRVFLPNPVVTLRNEGLTDRDDTDYAALRGAYRTVTLTDLDGSGHLWGKYAKVVLGKDLATSKARRFEFNRADDRFEQVMAYHSVTLAQRYIQSLGFADINNEPQDLKPDSFNGDNSFYDPSTDTITFGIGGVDDAEDAEVIWHEYGHAIQDAQVPGYGLGHDGGSIGEGFGDYWAATMSQGIGGNRDAPCVADWDSTSYTSSAPHCLRRTDTNTTFFDQSGEVHHDGQMWSRALWDINQALGRTKANRIILEAQFVFCPVVLFGTAAQTTVNTAQRLYAAGAAAVVRKAFASRGIRFLPEPPHVACGALPPLPV